jgi:release factor glutamine methyltransferase
MLDVGVRPGSKVLALGTDAGLVATAAAATGADATGVDVCLEAAAAACESACLRGIPVHLRYGQTPDRVAVGRFDLIVANPPYQLDSLCDLATRSLAPGGTILVAHSSDNRGVNAPLRHLVRRGLRAWVLLRRKASSALREDLVVIRADKP